MTTVDECANQVGIELQRPREACNCVLQAVEGQQCIAVTTPGVHIRCIRAHDSLEAFQGCLRARQCQQRRSTIALRGHKARVKPRAEFERIERLLGPAKFQQHYSAVIVCWNVIALEAQRTLIAVQCLSPPPQGPQRIGPVVQRGDVVGLELQGAVKTRERPQRLLSG